MKQRRIQIKQQRIMKYFIEAAEEIIKNEGMESITIRKAADLAGYTSATLYNYFDNLSHLIFLANMHHLKAYNNDLLTCISNCKNPIEIYMAVCKCFSVHAYERPEIFELLFFSQKEDELEKYVSQYFEIFPEEEEEKKPKFLDKMFHMNNLHSRSYAMLENCVKKGYIDEEKAKDFNDICLRFNKTILEDVKLEVLGKDEALALTLKYYYQLFRFYLNPEYCHLLDSFYEKMIESIN